MKKIPVIFLDRDGIINKPARPHEYIIHWEDFLVLPGVYGSLKAFRASGFKIFIVTNQRGISRGLTSLEEISELHRKMNEDFMKHGCCVDGIYICPHGHEDNCNCRKPKTGLLLQAQNDLEGAGLTVDKTRSWIIGDSSTDEEAGINYGINTVLVGYECSTVNDGRIHLTAKDISDAATKILEGSKQN